MHLDECDISWQEFYYDQAITIPLCFLLHIILFIYSLRNLPKVKHREINLNVPLFFITMQFFAIIWNTNEFIRHSVVARYYPSWFNNTAYCYLSSMISRAIVPTFYSLLVHLLLIKLRISFLKSFRPLSNICFYIILIILYSSLLILIISLFIFGGSACVASVYCSDISQYVHKCVHIVDGAALYAIYYGFITIIILNAIVGYIFVSKLNKVTSKEQHRNKMLHDMMIKNTILTLSLCFSSLIGWVLWSVSSYFDGFGLFIIHLDVFFNCLMVELMYFYNEKWYQLLCSKIGCIRCFRNCYVSRDLLQENKPDAIDTKFDEKEQNNSHAIHIAQNSGIIELGTPSSLVDDNSVDHPATSTMTDGQE